MSTEEEHQKIATVRSAISEAVKGSPALSNWCTRRIILRYLHAADGNVVAASKRLKRTLKWRAVVQPQKLHWSTVSEEGRPGKLFIMPCKDKQGRPILVSRPRLEATHNAEQHLKLLVYTLEAATRQADRSGPGTLIWLVDFTGCRPSKDLPVSVRATMKLLQRHYPLRLGAMFGYRPSFATPLIFKAMSPSLNAETRSKARFVSGSSAGSRLADEVGADTLEASMGGNNGYQYHHDSYGTKMEQEEFLLRSLQDVMMLGGSL